MPISKKNSSFVILSADPITSYLSFTCLSLKQILLDMSSHSCYKYANNFVFLPSTSLLHVILQELSVNVLFQLLEREGRGHQSVWSCYSFPNACLHSLVSLLLEKADESEALMGVCKTWLTYHDVLYHWLKNVA